MKQTLLLLFCLSLSYFASAQETPELQETPKQKEVGLVFRNLDGFGLTYRTGTEKSLWRFNTVFISGGSSTSTLDDRQNKSITTGFGLGAGKEWRKEIVQNFELRYGADLSFGFTYNKSETDDENDDQDFLTKNTTFEPGINFVFGFNYVIKEKIVFGLEVLPGVSYSTGKNVIQAPNEEDVTRNVSGFNFGLSNSSVLLSALYRF